MIYLYGAQIVKVILKAPVNAMNQVEGGMEEGLEKEVLIVSDDGIVSRMIGHLLRAKGMDVSHDNFLLEESETQGVRTSYPLVIYDFNKRSAPERDLSCCMNEYIRSNASSRIILSPQLIDCSSCDDFLIGRCAHFQKPFVTSELMEKVQSFTQL